MIKNNKKVIVIVGPTASGKSKLAWQLAKHFNGYLLSADSRQVYQGFDIGTGKDEGEWRRKGLKKQFFVDGVREELVDFISPKKDFTLESWLTLAKETIKQNEQTAFVIGGTGLYTTALVKGFALGGFDKKIKAKIAKIYETKGLKGIVAKLLVMDPDADKKLDIENPRRVMRALENCYLEEKTVTKSKKKLEYDFLQIGIAQPREVLYKKIDQRVELMFKAGLVDEVKTLLKKYPKDCAAMTGIGYRQVVEYLDGKITLEEAKEIVKRDSRHYAKRQLTWYRRYTDIHWVENYAEAEKLVRKFLPSQ